MKPTVTPTTSEDVSSTSEAPIDPKPKVKDDIPRFHSDDLDMVLEDEESEQYNNVSGFFTNLALCHTALASEEQDGTIEYMAQSPDEAALFVYVSVLLFLEGLLPNQCVSL